MTAARLATLCVLTHGDDLDYFDRCLDSLLTHTPRDAFELRLGFNDARHSFHLALGWLCHDTEPARYALLPGPLERFDWDSPDGLPVCAWSSPANLYKEPMARRLFHDVPLSTEYVVWFDGDSYVEAGWWQALLPHLQQHTDYLGHPWWVDYQPAQLEMIQAQPWYRGKPFELREGKPGVTFMSGNFFAARSACLREANFPDTLARWKGHGLQQYGGDVLLGQVSHQLGWTRAGHDEHVRVNLDLEGQPRHPPREGGRRI